MSNHFPEDVQEDKKEEVVSFIFGDTARNVIVIDPGVDIGMAPDYVRSGRTFSTGATRDSEEDKPDIEGFMHPAVIMEFAKYMHKHRKQVDGKLRDSDNWQKGIPIDAYMKSLVRHVMDLWLDHRGYESREGIVDALCGILFNAQGYLFEVIKANKK